MEAIKSYGRQTIEEDDIQAVISVLKGEYLTTGPTINLFEQKLAEYCQVSEAVVVSNGTAGLHLAMLALKLGKGDAVIVPALTFAATANAVLYVGATPVFADVTPKTWGLDVANVEKAYHHAIKNGLKPRAVTVVHFGGLPVELTPIRDFCKQKGLFLVEDACHALGSQYRASSDEPFSAVGNGAISDLTVFSFHPVKPITTGEGGALTTRRPDLAKALRALRSHGIVKDARDFQNSARALDTSGQVNPWYMEMNQLGYNYRLSDILAALGLSQLAKLDRFIIRRREIAKAYRSQLGSVANINLPPDDYEFGRSGYHLFTLEIDFKAVGKSRAQVMNELRERGVATQVMYLPVHWHPFYEQNKALWLATPLPKTEHLYEKLLAIPLFPTLTEQQVNATIQGIKATIA